MKRNHLLKWVVFSSLSAVAVLATFLIIKNIAATNAYNSKAHVADIQNCSADKTSLEDSFPIFNPIVDCRWDSGLLHEDNFFESLFDIGPSQYWVNGYIVINKSNIDALKKSYSWQEVSDFTQNFISIQKQIEFAQHPHWLMSSDFNTSFGGFFGNFYLDDANGIVVFDLIKD